MKQHRRWVALAGVSVFVLLAAACSDVSEEPPGDGTATDGGTSTVAQCGERDDRARRQPVGRGEGERGRRTGADGAGDGLHGRARGPDRRVGAVPGDGRRRRRRDARGLAVGARRRLRQQYIDEAGTVVDGGLLGITGNIGWFTPTYVVDQNPEYATWEGFKDDADMFATADTGDKGRFLGADTTYSIFDEQIIAALGLDLEVDLQRQRGASLAALDTAVENEEPILMYWWTPAVGEREVRPRRGRAARVHGRVRRHRAERPRGRSATTATTRTTSSTRRSAPSCRRRTRPRSSSCRTSSGPRRTRTASPSRSRRVRSRRMPPRRGSTRTTSTWQAWLPAASTRPAERSVRGRPLRWPAPSVRFPALPAVASARHRR